MMKRRSRFLSDTSELQKKAREIRATCIKMACDARETHLSSALSCVDILTVLFGGFLNYGGGATGSSPLRDRFILSKGHGCSAMYATLVAFGILPEGLLKTYSKKDSSLPNHPCKYALPLLEISTGSLGQGLGVASGMLYGLRLDGNNASRAVVLLSDAECNEGSTWEAAMFSAAQNLHNLLAIVDNNGYQAVAKTTEVMGDTLLEEKFRSFGWEAVVADGNDINALTETLARFPFSQSKPSAIIARTAVAAGINCMEGNHSWFYRSPQQGDVDNAVKELGASPICSSGDEI
jgi:transketolase